MDRPPVLRSLDSAEGFCLSLFFPESSSSERPSPDLSHQRRGSVLPHPPHPPGSSGGVGESRPSPPRISGPPGAAAGRLRGSHQPRRLPPSHPHHSSSACLRHHKPSSRSSAAAGGHGGCASLCRRSSLCPSPCPSSSSPHCHQGGEPAVRGGAAGDGVSGRETGGGGERRKWIHYINDNILTL